MQVMRLADVLLDQRDRVFHYSRFRAVAGAITLGAIALGALAFGWLKSVWLAYYVAAVVAICLLVFQRLVTARFLSSNWLIRMTDHGMFVKFRSYLNHHFSNQDPAVVFLSYAEVRAARLIKERQVVFDWDDRSPPATTIKRRRLIGLELAGDTTPLKEALANERQRVFDKPSNGGGGKTRYHHLPVRLASATLLTIEWGVVPSAQTLLDALTRHTLVQTPTAVSKDFVDLDNLTKEQQETRLLELAESGDIIGAVAIARRLYSYDLTTAKAFVDGLLQKQRKAPIHG
jgi:hypothetical protein